ncbi:MAG: ferrous iron transport protein A [Tetragenococcus halophilus]|nr:ferrous iron transport protein A [Tetragenococcus halophilus]
MIMNIIFNIQKCYIANKERARMKQLTDVQYHSVYQVHDITTLPDTKKHLQTIGVVPGKKISLLQLEQQNGIILLQKSRIALDRSILENIFVEEVQEKSAWVPLDQLNASEQATVVSIHGEGAVRRRLMDMGVTKNVQIYVRKLAPLGDPVEITLRGYELTLRKKEASLILVEKEI